MPRRLPRILLFLGWFFLVSGAITLFGHALRPATADVPGLGKYGGWILDAMSIGLGVGALSVRKRLRASTGNAD